MAAADPHAPTAELHPSLADRRYLVLGGSGGIGSALTRRLVGRGAEVVVAARRSEPLEQLAAELGGAVKVQQVDARDFGAVQELVELVRGEGDGRLDGAVNCVGSILLKPAHLTSPDDFGETIGHNLGSAFALVRAMGRAAARQPEGASVVLLSTVAARVGLANHEAIAAAKAGVEGLTRSAAATYAAAGIRVNAVAPGLTDTPLAARITSNERALEASKKMHPLGRIGTADEIARVIEWLVGPEGSWVSGQVISVDGGLSTLRSG